MAYRTPELSSAGPTFAPNPAEPLDESERIVAELWEKVLQRGKPDRDTHILSTKVGVLRIYRLLTAIEAATGVALPLTIVCHAPTVAALAQLVRSRNVPVSTQIAPLRAGEPGHAPLFMFGGLGGLAFEMFDLAQKIDYPGPIYAGQYQGLDGGDEPHRRIVDMARYQSAAIRHIQPHGPYWLAGYSLGGLIAIETARLLEESGETIAFLGALEAQLSEPMWPATARAAFMVSRVGHHLSAMRQLPPKKAAGYLVERAQPLVGRVRRMLGIGAKESASPYVVENLPVELQRVRDASIAAFYEFRPEAYAGRLDFFVTKAGDPFTCDQTKVWPRVIKNFVAHRLSGGDHATMIREPIVSELAQSVSICLATKRGG